MYLECGALLTIQSETTSTTLTRKEKKKKSPLLELGRGACKCSQLAICLDRLTSCKAQGQAPTQRSYILQAAAKSRDSSTDTDSMLTLTP